MKNKKVFKIIQIILILSSSIFLFAKYRGEQLSRVAEIERQKKQYRFLDKEQYKDLITGGFNSDDLEFILPYIDDFILEHKDENTLFLVSVLSSQNKSFIKDYGFDKKLRASKFSLKDVNRLLSLYTDKQYTDDDNRKNLYIDEKNDVIALNLTVIPFSTEGKIKETLFNEEKNDLKILFSSKSIFTTKKDKKETDSIAHLKTQEDGKYRIVKIENVPHGLTLKEHINMLNKKKEIIPRMKGAYEEILKSYREKTWKYGKIKGKVGKYNEDTKDFNTDEPFSYFLMDLNGDDLKELVMTTQIKENKNITTIGKIYGFFGGKIVEFTMENQEDNSIRQLDFLLSKDGRYLYTEDFPNEKGEFTLNKITVDYGTFSVKSTEFYKYKSINEKAFTNFKSRTKKIELKSLETKVNMEN